MLTLNISDVLSRGGISYPVKWRSGLGIIADTDGCMTTVLTKG